MINVNFTLTDYTNSNTAKAQGIDEQFTPTADIIANLLLLHSNIIVPLLNYLSGNLICTSGYRCERLNTVVGGTVNSDHIKGMASDLNYFDEKGTKRDDILLQTIKDLRLKYRQLGDEHHAEWLHIAYNKDDLKMQIFNVV